MSNIITDNNSFKKNLKSKISYIFKVTLYDNLYIDHKL